MIAQILALIAGLALLVAGAEVLISGASALARRLGVRPIIVGLTVVAFGTSAPELVVSLFAGLQGRSEVAVANVVGSNIFNIGAILGLAAMIRPLKVHVDAVRREIPFMLGSALLLGVLCADGKIGRLDGAILLGGFFLFMFKTFSWSKSVERSAVEPAPSRRRFAGLAFVSGLVLLVVGAWLFVGGAIAVARHLRISELVIGLTIVAAGTSLPELAASVMAAWHGEDDIAVGNVTGSNIFNILFILGLCAVWTPLDIDRAAGMRDLGAMVLFSIVLIPVMRTGFVISRAEGALLFAAYTGYTVLLASGWVP